MAHNATCRDIGDNYYSDTLPHDGATPYYPYIPERERANAPPQSTPEVGAREFTASISSLTMIVLLRLHLPHRALPFLHDGVSQLCTQASKSTATVHRTTYGPNRRIVLRVFLPWQALFHP
jgi:hypothetical protein